MQVVNVLRLYYIYMSPSGYTMYCGKTMNILLPEMGGEIEND